MMTSHSFPVNDKPGIFPMKPTRLRFISEARLSPGHRHFLSEVGHCVDVLTCVPMNKVDGGTPDGYWVEAYPSL